MHAIQPVGAPALTFLRRVQMAGEPLHAELDELPAAHACHKAGYLHRIPDRLGLYEITPAGISYLAALARAH